MNSKKRHLDLLRKRYRLPISLLTHEIPPDSPLRETGFEEFVDAGGKVKVKGLVNSIDDALELTNLCARRGAEKLSIRYADYIALTCVDGVKQHLTSVREEEQNSDSKALKIAILNPGVPREKMRLLAKLDTFSTKLSDVLNLVGQDSAPQQRHRLEDLRLQIGLALEKATVHAASVELIKKAHLDWLLLLELSYDASTSARQEGIWILKHMYPAEHEQIHLDGKLVMSALVAVRQRIQERVIDREDIPSPVNLRDARQGLLGAVGRHHLECNLVLALEKACATIDQYLKEEATEVEVSEVLNLQLKVLQNMMNKRSLIGCRFIDLDDDSDDETDTESEQSVDSGHEGSIQGEYDPKHEYVNVDADNMIDIVYAEEDEDENDMSVNQQSPCSSESSVDSPMHVQPAPKEETPISASSFVSTHSEIGDADFAILLKLEHSDDDKDEDGNLEKSGKLSSASSPVLTDAPCASTGALSPSSTAASSPAPAATSSASRRLPKGDSSGSYREHQHNASGGDSSSC